jgi:hypothetical protein
MSSFRSATRRLSGSVAGVLLLLGTAVVVAPAAQAVNHDGILSLKGVGTKYTSANPTTVVALAGSSGQTLSFGMKVYNAGLVPTQYNIKLESSGLPATVGLYSGSTLLFTATTTDGYYTAPMMNQSGLSYTLKVKATVPVGSSLRHTEVKVTMSASDGTFLKEARARFEVKAPTRGSALADGYARSGSLPYVGSLTDTQYASSPYIPLNESTKFTVKQAVNAGAPHRLHAYIPVLTDGQCFTVTAFAGTVDVTSQVANGSYLTKVMSPGQSSLLTVQITRGNWGFCANTQVDVYTYTEDGQSVGAVRLLVP